MLDDKDIKKLIDVFATKDDLNKAVENLTNKDDFNRMMNALDKYADKADTYFQEMVVLSHKVDKHETWIHQLAEKLGVKLEY